MSTIDFKFSYKGKKYEVKEEGNGPIDAVLNAIRNNTGVKVKLLDYTEHTLGEGSHAKAASYIQLMDKETGKATFGVGVSSNITRSSIRAIFSALDRLF
jgi:2-isopropylmalate synthase